MVSPSQSVHYVGAFSFVLVGQAELVGSLSPREWQELLLKPLWLGSKANARAKDESKAEPQ